MTAAAAEPVLADRAPKPPAAARYRLAWLSARHRAAAASGELDGLRSNLAAAAPAGRLSASTITDYQLDALYAERDRAQATLREVLGHFTQLGHPGEPCWRTGWIREATVKRWLAALDGPSEPRTAPTAALMSPVGLRGAPEAAGGPR